MCDPTSDTSSIQVIEINDIIEQCCDELNEYKADLYHDIVEHLVNQCEMVIEDSNDENINNLKTTVNRIREYIPKT